MLIHAGSKYCIPIITTTIPECLKTCDRSVLLPGVLETEKLFDNADENGDDDDDDGDHLLYLTMTLSKGQLY